eukprot:8306930-Ditylum_brightwellii.AAC.1
MKAGDGSNTVGGANGNFFIFGGQGSGVPLSWPQNQEMAPTTQGVCRKCKITAGDIAPRINDALGARYWWGRWWGRCGRINGVTK